MYPSIAALKKKSFFNIRPLFNKSKVFRKLRVGGEEQRRKGTKIKEMRSCRAYLTRPQEIDFLPVGVPKKVQTSKQKNEVCACECKCAFRKDNLIAITGFG